MFSFFNKWQKCYQSPFKLSKTVANCKEYTYIKYKRLFIICPQLPVVHRYLIRIVNKILTVSFSILSLTIKVQLFWEGHKNLHNFHHGFDLYLVNVKTIRKSAPSQKSSSPNYSTCANLTKWQFHNDFESLIFHSSLRQNNNKNYGFEVVHTLKTPKVYILSRIWARGFTWFLFIVIP